MKMYNYKLDEHHAFISYSIGQWSFGHIMQITYHFRDCNVVLHLTILYLALYILQYPVVNLVYSPCGLQE